MGRSINMTDRKTLVAPIIPLIADKKQAIALLKKQIELGNKLLLGKVVNKDDFDVWESVTKDFLIKSFGAQSDHIQEVIDIGRYGSFPMRASTQYWDDKRRKDLVSKIKILEGLIDVLITEDELQTLQNDVIPGQNEDEKNNKSIFLVHGHNDSLVHEIARYLQLFDLKVTILREQPNEGRTIIEKFEDFSDVGFAVILLTPDDIGGIKNTPIDKLNPRARQNVILELGYFLGKLGRKRVCSLYQEGVEIPSDFSGVLFVLLDKGGYWKINLAKEIKAAGIPIDLNKVI